MLSSRLASARGQSPLKQSLASAIKKQIQFGETEVE